MSRHQTSTATSVTQQNTALVQAKARVYERGLTLKQFAEQNQLTYRTVSEVVRGVNKGLFGEGHRAAVALGIKQG